MSGEEPVQNEKKEGQSSSVTVPPFADDEPSGDDEEHQSSFLPLALKTVAVSLGGAIVTALVGSLFTKPHTDAKATFVSKLVNNLSQQTVPVAASAGMIGVWTYVNIPSIHASVAKDPKYKFHRDVKNYTPLALAVGIPLVCAAGLKLLRK
jgi:hypothetical protein